MRELTPRQEQALDFIRRSVKERGYPPTLREIGRHMGVRSTNGVVDHLLALERKGYITRSDKLSRGIVLTHAEESVAPMEGAAEEEATVAIRVYDSRKGK